MNKKEVDSTVASLEIVNKQLTEMKKKIQLLGRCGNTSKMRRVEESWKLNLFTEGQRRAHYEMWDSEKKKNTEKIKLLKDSVKKLYSQLAEQTMVRACVIKRDEMNVYEIG